MKVPVLVAALALISACADSTAPRAAKRAPRDAARDMDVNQTVPVATTSNNPCNGDVVPVTGTSHIVVHTTTSASGNEHVYSDVTTNLSGVGAPSGLNYNGSTRDLSDFTTNDPYPIVQMIDSEMDMNSQTGVNNFYARFRLKVTINANGIPTAEILDFTTTCKG